MAQVRILDEVESVLLMPLGKTRIHPFYPSYGDIEEHTGFLTLVMQLVKEKKSDFKTSRKTLKELALCHILLMAEGLGKYISLMKFNQPIMLKWSKNAVNIL